MRSSPLSRDKQNRLRQLSIIKPDPRGYAYVSSASADQPGAGDSRFFKIVGKVGVKESIQKMCDSRQIKKQDLPLLVTSLSVILPVIILH
jgi:hypothetical protein